MLGRDDLFDKLMEAFLDTFLWLALTPAGWATFIGCGLLINVVRYLLDRLYPPRLRWTCPRKSCGHIYEMIKCPNCKESFNSGINYQPAKDVLDHDYKFLYRREATAGCKNCNCGFIESKPCVKCGTWIHESAGMIAFVRKRRLPD